MHGASWFIERLERFRQDPALVWQGRICTYSELLHDIRRWREELGRQNVRSGECVAFCGDCSPRTCALMLALIGNGNIVVPLSRTPASEIDSLLALGQVQGVFDFDSDDQWSFHRREPDAAPHQLLTRLRAENEPGLILFSSGSTGEPKGIVHNLSLLLDKFRTPRPKIRSLVFLLLDHIGGINTLFHILANGGTAVSPPDRRPETICRAIQEHRVEVLPTTPTFLTMLLASGLNGDYDLSSLKLITYGTEPMPEATLEQLGRDFPGVRLKQTYGMTELGILGTKSRDSKTLWMKIGGRGIETKIVDGKLWIRSKTPMLGYLNAPSPFDEAGWYNTEDEAEIDGEYVRILGRASDIISVGGEKVYPAEVESVLLKMSNVREATIQGRRNPVTGEIVTATVSLFQPEDACLLKRRIWDHCTQEGLSRYKIPVLVNVVDLGQHCTERFKKARTARAAEG